MKLVARLAAGIGVIASGIVGFVAIKSSLILSEDWSHVGPTVSPLPATHAPDAEGYADAVLRGQYLYQTRLGCADCHGPQGAGRLVADALPVVRMAGSNITSGGLGETLQLDDLDRIVRHGVDRKSRASMMPAVDFFSLSDAELHDLYAYVLTFPSVSEPFEPSATYGPVGRALLAFGELKVPAARIDHNVTPAEFPPPEHDSVQYGGHLAQGCVGCHGPDLSGGPIQGGDPAWPEAANIRGTEDGIAAVSLQSFMRSLQEGIGRDGQPLSGVMPTATYAGLKESDVESLYVYLQTLR